MEGYQIVPSYEDADVVVVNTCGFIDSAKAESLDAIGEAIAENGKVIVTGCMGVDENNIRGVHPSVLAVTGPQQYEQVVNAVHEVVPPSIEHDPFVDLVPPQGIKLTPRHYAYLKISEGCNHSCSFCIIPSMRGKLVSRPVGDVLSEAERLVKAGVKEVLVISQDTSAYGVDLKYKLDFWNGQPVKTRMLELCEELGKMGVCAPALRLPLPQRRRRDPADGRRQDPAVPGHPLPARQPESAQGDEAPGVRGQDSGAHQEMARDLPRADHSLDLHRRLPGETEEDFQYLLDWLTEAQLDRVGCFQYSPVDGAPAEAMNLEPVPDEIKQDRWDRFMAHQQAISAARLQLKVGKELDVLIDEVDEDGAIGRSWADAPEIDGMVYVDSEQPLQPGDKVRVRVTNADEYDLWAEVI